MPITLWIVYKKGADRPYIHTSCPPGAHVRRWRQEGFSIFQVRVYLPVRDGADGLLYGSAEPAEL